MPGQLTDPARSAAKAGKHSAVTAWAVKRTVKPVAREPKDPADLVPDPDRRSSAVGAGHHEPCEGMHVRTHVVVQKTTVQSPQRVRRVRVVARRHEESEDY